MWYTYWLACVEGITGDRKCELCRKNGSAEAVYYIEEKGIREQWCATCQEDNKK